MANIVVTGLTAARMIAIEGASVIDGNVNASGHLILKKFNNDTIDAGPVIGPAGPVGPTGSISASPAGGDLTGNYPDPKIKLGAVTGLLVADALKDAAANVPSLRSLGVNPTQAAAGNHNHSDTTFRTSPNLQPGTAPFASVNTAVDFVTYRRWGPMVFLNFQFISDTAVDRSANTTGNFPNITVFTNLVARARPSEMVVPILGRFDDTPVLLNLLPDGSMVWGGGFPRNYPANSALQGAVMFMTDAAP